jgi:hypothetical protein
MWRPGGAVALASRGAVALAAAMGVNQLRELLGYYTGRWTSQPKALRFDGAELIGCLARHGAGRLSLRRALEGLEAALDQTGAAPSDWVTLGPAWLELGDRDAASRCLRRAVRLTLSPSSDKDLQLATWIRLMAPLLQGPDGPELSDRVSGALESLDRRGSGGSPDYAARALLEILAPRDPDEAWRLAGPLLDAHVLRVDEVIEVLITACSDRPTGAWWTVAGELLPALGVGPPHQTLAAAARADPDLAGAWLPVLAERVAVEGRPSERRAWRRGLLEAGRSAGLSTAQVDIPPAELEITDEAPESHGGGAPDREPSEPKPIASLLADAERADAPEEREDAVRKLSRRLDELDRDQLARLLAAGRGTESEARLCARLAAAAAAGDPDEAWALGMAALRLSSSGDWSRRWAGGPMLDLIPVLFKLDRPQARQAVLARFAELAGEVDHFLGTVGESLRDYVHALELPEVELAREALGVAGALLRDIAPLPDPGAPRASRTTQRAPGDPQGALEALVVRLLGFEQTLAWQAAQRALLEFARLGVASVPLHAGLSGAPEPALRSCAVVQAAAGWLREDEALARPLEELTRAARLDLRLGAVACLDALGRSVPSLGPPRELPAALRLELPPRHVDRRVVDGLEESLGFWRPQLEALSDLAGVDEDALHDHVLLRARAQLDGLEDIDRLPDADSILGWGYVKPSARAIRVALAEAGAELLDARRVGAGGALRAVELHPPVDPGMLVHRPTRRPRAVATFIAREARSRLYGRELSELAAEAADRLAQRHEGWAVLGEHSEVAVLDRTGHHELRRSGLARAKAADGFGPHVTLAPLTLRDYRGLSRGGQVDRGIVRPFAAPAGTPAGWLALHPRLAGSLGLKHAEPGWLDWTLDGRLAVRSLWWRSGYLRWNPYSEDDEVGEGWLVLGSPEIIEGLIAGGWELAYEVRTSRRGDGDLDGHDIEVQGRRTLPSG